MFDNVGGDQVNEGSLIVGFAGGVLCCPAALVMLVMGGRDTKIGAVFALMLQLVLVCMGVVGQVIAMLAAG